MSHATRKWAAFCAVIMFRCTDCLCAWYHLVDDLLQFVVVAAVAAAAVAAVAEARKVLAVLIKELRKVAPLEVEESPSFSPVSGASLRGWRSVYLL